jgi:ParB-like chromosome segregation protein Spo0J
MIKYDELIWIDPKDVIVNDRIRSNLGDIQDLADRIKSRGLRHPITINKKNELKAGQRRFEALKLLGEKKIPAFVNETADPLDLEIDENVGRKNFTPGEAVDAADKILERIGSRQGKRYDLFNYQEDTLPGTGDGSKKGLETRDYIAHEVGLGRKTLQNAKRVIQRFNAKELKSEIVKAMNEGIISVRCAYKISGEKNLDKQITLLNDAINDPETSGEELAAMSYKRRAAKRLKRFNIPDGPDADPVYTIIRVAPDWSKEKQDDIEDLPVADYCIPTAVVAVECPMESVGKAIDAIEAWGFTYRSILTVFEPGIDKAGTDHHAFSQSRSWHICIGTLDPEVDGAHTKKMCPAFKTLDPRGELVERIEEIWPDKADKRLDMSSIEPRKGWKIWKLDYATKEK